MRESILSVIRKIENGDDLVRVVKSGVSSNITYDKLRSTTITQVESDINDSLSDLYNDTLFGIGRRALLRYASEWATIPDITKTGDTYILNLSAGQTVYEDLQTDFVLSRYGPQTTYITIQDTPNTPVGFSTTVYRTTGDIHFRTASGVTLIGPVLPGMFHDYTWAKLIKVSDTEWDIVSPYLIAI